MGNDLSLCCGQRTEGTESTKEEFAFFKRAEEQRSPLAASTKASWENGALFKADQVQGKEKRKQSWQKNDCGLCGKTVYFHDRSLNSRGDVFHKECLRCHDCGISLAEKEPVGSDGPSMLQSRQYRHSTDDQQTILQCAKHGSKVTSTIVSGTSRLAKRESHKVVCASEEVSAKRESAKEKLTVIMGDYVPVCNRCGFGFASDEDVVVNGMEKYHKTCPTAAQTEQAVHVSKRVFIRRAPERVVAAVRTDKQEDNSKTFFFALSEAVREEILKENTPEAAPVALPYRFESAAKSNAERQVDFKELQLSVTLRGETYTAEDPVRKETFTPQVGALYHGQVNVNGQQVYMKASFDGTLVFGNSKEDVLSENVLSESSAKTTTVPITQACKLHFFDAKEGKTGLTLSADAPGDEHDIQVETSSWHEATLWVLAIQRLQRLIASDEGRVLSDGEWDAVGLQLFKMSGGILHRFEIIARVSMREKKLTCLHLAELYLTNVALDDPPQVVEITMSPGEELPSSPKPLFRHRRRSSSGSMNFVKEKLRFWGEADLEEEIDSLVKESEQKATLTPRSGDQVRKSLKAWASAKFDDQATEDDVPPLSPRTSSVVGSRIQAWSNKIEKEKNNKHNAQEGEDVTTPKKKSKVVFGGSTPKCFACNEPVFATDLFSLEGKQMHQACFKCSHCGRKLSLSNFSINANQLFCKEHYMEIFKKSGGKYNF